MFRRTAIFVATALSVLGCGRLEETVERADDAYHAARYADAETWLLRVEPDVGALERPAQLRFYFVRGMTAYRLERRDDALHYLALARALSESPALHGELERDEAAQLQRALSDLVLTSADHRARPAFDDEGLVSTPE